MILGESETNHQKITLGKNRQKEVGADVPEPQKMKNDQQNSFFDKNFETLRSTCAL